VPAGVIESLQPAGAANVVTLTDGPIASSQVTVEGQLYLNSYFQSARISDVNFQLGLGGGAAPASITGTGQLGFLGAVASQVATTQEPGVDGLDITVPLVGSDIVSYASAGNITRTTLGGDNSNYTGVATVASGELAVTSNTGLSGTPTATAAGSNIPVMGASATATTGGSLAAATYFYVVTSIVGGVESFASAEKSQVTTGAASTVTINCTAVGGATGYKIYRSTNVAGGETLLTQVGAVATFTDTNAIALASPILPPSVILANPTITSSATATTGGTLAAGTYYYKVTAYSNLGESLASNEISQATTGAASTVTLSFAAVPNAIGYRIYRSTASGIETLVATIPAQGFAGSLIDTGTAAGAILMPASTIISAAGETLDLAGGINVTGEFLDITAVGAGIAGAGQVRSLSGNNTWTANLAATTGNTGNIFLNSGAGQSVIGVNSGSTLTLNAPISSAAALAGVTKLLGGTLVYAGTIANTYTGPTILDEGMLVLNKTQAAPVSGTATAGSTTSVTLQSATNVSVGQSIFFTGGTGAGQSATIIALSGLVATLSPALTAAPASGTTYTINVSAIPM